MILSLCCCFSICVREVYLCPMHCYYTLQTECKKPETNINVLLHCAYSLSMPSPPRVCSMEDNSIILNWTEVGESHSKVAVIASRGSQVGYHGGHLESRVLHRSATALLQHVLQPPVPGYTDDQGATSH